MPRPKLPDVSKEDPKPGRWVLPIVIIALIGFTYIFVTSLPEADVAASTTTTVAPTTTIAPVATTTTTLPNDILAFLQELDRFEGVAEQLQTDLNAVNESWEAGDIEIEQAEAGFTAVRDGAQVLANEVAATSVPDQYTPAWPDTIAASQALVSAADAVVAGLLAPDDGSARRESVVAYNEATIAFTNQLDVVRSLNP